MVTLFDNILRGEIPSHFVSEGEQWFAFLDIFPRRSGHTLVIPRRSVRRLSELNSDERGALTEGFADVQQILGRHFSTSDFTVCIHDGPLAGQEVPHVHIHVIPRTEGDGGATSMAMWPPQSAGEPNHSELARLSSDLQGGSK